jgi:hypothetical protein
VPLGSFDQVAGKFATFHRGAEYTYPRKNAVLFLWMEKLPVGYLLRKNVLENRPIKSGLSI